MSESLVVLLKHIGYPSSVSGKRVYAGRMSSLDFCVASNVSVYILFCLYVVL